MTRTAKVAMNSCSEIFDHDDSHRANIFVNFLHDFDKLLYNAQWVRKLVDPSVEHPMSDRHQISSVLQPPCEHVKRVEMAQGPKLRRAQT